jgi:hypothetical protein
MHIRKVLTPALVRSSLLLASTPLLLCAVIGCTSTPAQTTRPVATAMPAAVPSTTAVPSPTAVPSAAVRSKAYVTGSRLPVPVDSRTGLAQADPSLQVVTPEQIGTTGQPNNLGVALRQLVPAIQ